LVALLDVFTLDFYEGPVGEVGLGKGWKQVRVDGVEYEKLNKDEPKELSYESVLALYVFHPTVLEAVLFFLCARLFLMS
jgi:hypothetical protein